MMTPVNVDTGSGIQHVIIGCVHVRLSSYITRGWCILQLSHCVLGGVETSGSQTYLHLHVDSEFVNTATSHE